jgi:hypothetical protein
VAAQVLQKLGAELIRVRQKVIELLGGPSGVEATAVPAPNPEAMPLCPKCGVPLSESVAFRVLDVPPAGEGEARAVALAFCRRCGTSLGTVA